MKQIKAFVHRNRVGDIVHTLEAAGFNRLSLFDVKGLLRALDAKEQEYSVELGGKIIHEMQMELFCADEDVERVVAIFLQHGRTGRPDAGWLYICPVDESFRID